MLVCCVVEVDPPLTLASSVPIDPATSSSRSLLYIYLLPPSIDRSPPFLPPPSFLPPSLHPPSFPPPSLDQSISPHPPSLPSSLHPSLPVSFLPPSLPLPSLSPSLSPSSLPPSLPPLLQGLVQFNVNGTRIKSIPRVQQYRDSSSTDIPCNNSGEGERKGGR